jgi:4-hydroxy-tetrahydrodipicolinate synthase
VNKIKAQSFDGIDAIMSIAPYYNKPQQKGLYYHFRTVANASPVPVFLYNDPARTSVNINADTTLKLAKDVNNIVGINESSGDLKQIMQIMSGKPPDFKVLSGDDILTLPLLSLGAEGAISVVANIFPKEYSEMVKLGLNSKWIEARQKHYRLLEIIDAVFADGNPSGIKAALDSMGLCKNNLRLPLVKVNKAVYKQLKILIEEFKD